MDGHDGGGHDGFGHGGHADMGHGHGHGMSDLDATGHGHGVGDADAFAHSGHITAEALMVSHSHCHGAGWGDTFGHFSMDSSHGFHHGPDFGGINGEAEGRKAFRNKLEKAKIDPRRTFFGAHVVGHGYSETTRIFANLAKANGLVRVCDTVGNFNPVDLMVMELTDWNKYVGPFNRKFPTGGWYKGANGLTTIWKQYWQVGTQRPWWDPFGRVKYNRLKATYLEVSIVTWYYSDIGDYETRIDINVMSTPVLDPVADVMDRLGPLARRGLRGHVVEVADPAEELFPYAGRTEFTDPESGMKLTAGRAETLKDDYARAYAARRESLADNLRHLGWSFITHRTDRLASEALVAVHAYLSGLPAMKTEGIGR